MMNSALTDSGDGSVSPSDIRDLANTIEASVFVNGNSRIPASSAQALVAAKTIYDNRAPYIGYSIEISRSRGVYRVAVYFYQKLIGDGSGGNVYSAVEYVNGAPSGDEYIVKESSDDTFIKRSTLVERVAAVRREFETNRRLERRMGAEFMDKYCIPAKRYFVYGRKGVIVFSKLIGRDLQTALALDLQSSSGSLYMDLKDMYSGRMRFENVLDYVKRRLKDADQRESRVRWVAQYMRVVTTNFIVGYQLLKIVRALAKNGIGHFDLKPENIVIDVDATPFNLDNLASEFAQAVTSEPPDVRLIDFAGMCFVSRGDDSDFREKFGLVMETTCGEEDTSFATPAYTDPLFRNKVLDRRYYEARAQALEDRFGIISYNDWLEFRNARYDMYSVGKTLMRVFSTPYDRDAYNPSFPTVDLSFMAPPRLTALLLLMTGDAPVKPYVFSQQVSTDPNLIRERVENFYKRPTMDEVVTEFVAIGNEFFDGPIGAFMRGANVSLNTLNPVVS